jgi:hypothetical protein
MVLGDRRYSPFPIMACILLIVSILSLNDTVDVLETVLLQSDMVLVSINELEPDAVADSITNTDDEYSLTPSL